jgi:dCTP deaminase
LLRGQKQPQRSFLFIGRSNNQVKVLLRGYTTMIKPDHWIIEFAKNGGITPFNPEHVNPASYDVTVGSHWICPTRDPEELISDSIVLFPGEVILATTQEFVRMPRDVVCDLKLKSSLGRLWLNHSLSGWIDCGFSGQITLELQNLGPYPRELVKGMRVAQLVFLGMESAPTVAYGEGGRGHYQGQTGATKAWSDDFFPRVLGPKKG